MPTGYSADLAYIHDEGFAAFAEQAAPGLLRLLRHAGIRAGRVVDVGCGSGLWAQQLVRHGYQVLGIDISAPMIALARRREPQATFRVGSFLRAKLPRCVAITSIGECLGYLFDRRNGDEALADWFARANEALEPGGLLIFDVLTALRGAARRDAQRWRAGADWAVLVKLTEDRAAGQLTREIISFRLVGRSYRRTDEVHRIHLFDERAVRQALERQGFTVKLVKGYGKLPFDRGHVGFVARRR